MSIKRAMLLAVIAMAIAGPVWGDEIGAADGETDALSDMLRSEELSLGLIAGALALSLFLGAAHGLEPGHGKTIVAAYLVGTRGTVGNALFLGGVVALTHTSSVILPGLSSALCLPVRPSRTNFPLSRHGVRSPNHRVRDMASGQSTQRARSWVRPLSWRAQPYP